MSREQEQLPVIQTERLILRPPRLDDAAALFVYASDPEVARFTTWEPHTTVDDSRAFLEHVVANNGAGSGRTWAITLRDDDRIIGTFGLLVHSRRDRRAELAYAISRAHWNRGLVTEAATAVAAFAFDILELNRLEAVCELPNIASARVMEKLGMRREGVLRQYMFGKGSFRDVKLYSVLREEWLSLPPAAP